MSTITPPQIYSIKCIELDRPYFKIGKIENQLNFKKYIFFKLNLNKFSEVHTINETTKFLRNLIYDIGLKLRTYAICVQIRRVRDGFVDYKTNCLAHPEWNFDNIYQSTLRLTKEAKDYIEKFDKKIVLTDSHLKAKSTENIQTNINKF